MRTPHLQGGALLTACAAGQGAVVVVEGERRQDMLQHDLLCSMYLAQHPEPHGDLRNIVDAILIQAALLR